MVAVDNLVVVGVKKQHRGFYDQVATISIANLTENVNFNAVTVNSWWNKHGLPNVPNSASGPTFNIHINVGMQ